MASPDRRILGDGDLPNNDNNNYNPWAEGRRGALVPPQAAQEI